MIKKNIAFLVSLSLIGFSAAPMKAQNGATVIQKFGYFLPSSDLGRPVSLFTNAKNQSVVTSNGNTVLTYHFDIPDSYKPAHAKKAKENESFFCDRDLAAKTNSMLAQNVRTFIHAPNGDFTKSHEDTIINYQTWDGTNWTAIFKCNKFIHAPNGDFTKSHEDTIINYVTWGGTKWTAKVEGDKFIHAPNGDFSKSHEDTIINYQTWGGGYWTGKFRTP